MAGFYAVFISTLAIFTLGVLAEGELDIIHSPSSLKWTGKSRLQESLLKEVYSASFGLSVEESSNWSGLAITDPFSTPEAIVEVFVDGVANIGNADKLKWQRYPLALDEYYLDTFPALSHRIRQRYPEAENKLVNMVLNDQDSLNEYSFVFGNIKLNKAGKRNLQYLKPSSVDEDAQFIQELDVLVAIAEKVRQGVVSADNLIDFYHLSFQSLHPLSDLYGADSLQTKEAKKLLVEAFEQLSSAFEKAYDGAVLVTVVSSDATHTRRAARSLQQANEPELVKISLTSQYNLVEPNSEDYPAIFNIILWFGVVFAFSLLAIVYAIMDMDPGRDSIIYRMTSNRMKKDN